MMAGLFTWKQFVLIGMFIATVLWLPVFIVVGTWAGWPRRREKDAWEAAERAQEQHAEEAARAVLTLLVGSVCASSERAVENRNDTGD